MCGFIGIAGPTGHALSITPEQAVAMRDRMEYRGPDDAGLWHHENIMLAHRRLSVIDPDAEPQPFTLAPAANHRGGVLVYNGELYNAAELRTQLESRGARFTTHCDTEIVAHALAHWGVDALTRFRGMFALAWCEPGDDRLLLARDALGIKPLYYATALTPHGPEFVFGSAIPAILMHPHMRVQPDWITVSAYLSTIRTTLGHRTMFDGVHTLEPGTYATVDLKDATPTAEVRTWWAGPQPVDTTPSIEATRAIIDASIDAHLVSDVPVASLLSGGLDSAIITGRATQHPTHQQLRTFCIGNDRDPGGMEDLAHARLVARTFGTEHYEVGLDRDDFASVWPWMIGALGTPLSTPNEVAIFAVASAVADHAKVVLSGEGADELFGGYAPILEATAQFIARNPDADNAAAASFYIELTSWIPGHLKSHVLTPTVLNAAFNDSWLHHTIEQMFDEQASCDAAIDRHARVQGRVNLTGLLGRLDSATMLASVEGRTPFADMLVAEHAMAIGMNEHALFSSLTQRQQRSGGAPGVTKTTGPDPTMGKQLLRRAYANDVPTSVLHRPKQSFPIPFQGWIGDHVREAADSSTVQQVFRADAINTINAAPAEHWNLTWPMTNVMIWLRTFFN